MDHTQEIDMDKPIVFYRHIPAEDEPNCEINTVRYDRYNEEHFYTLSAVEYFFPFPDV